MRIKDAMRRITQSEIYLPAIQRKFVWNAARIEGLFDSIMRGYPIGTFLFWFVRGDERDEDGNVRQGAKDQYSFYKFIQHFHERDRPWNELAPSPDLRDQFIGVLDGQQRLNSMYVALQGSYASKRKHGRWNDDAAFPRRSMYVNLLHQADDDEDDNASQFKFAFLREEEAREVDDRQYWFPVKEVLRWDDVSPSFESMNAARRDNPNLPDNFERRCGPLLQQLFQRLCLDAAINYFSIPDQDLDRVGSIFVRVNSAGMQLSKSDLLFSSIVGHWNDGRSNIENLIQTLNGKGKRFAFDNDFVMRCCLVLADLPVRLSANSFRRENIVRIRDSWPAIAVALEKTVDLLVEWGFCAETLPTLNAVIPIAYFAMKGGDMAASNADLRQYLVRALVNQIFAAKTDRVLGTIRDRLRREEGDGFVLRNRRLEIRHLLEPEMSRDWSLQVSPADIDELLGESKSSYSFMLLSLLYPHLRFDQVQFHQDHIHPSSAFTVAKLRRLNIAEPDIVEWIRAKDTLPNLQLMEGLENTRKNATAFEEWLETQGALRDAFLQRNLIPANVNLSLVHFEAFLAARRALMRQSLLRVFGLPEQPQ
jgi:uncharacterized protein with ParB-like and HNH nuclease domain